MAPVLESKRPFSIDTIVSFLDKVPLSPPFIVLIPVLTLLFDSRHGSVKMPTLAGWRELMFTKYKWCGYLLLYVVFKAISRHMKRRARNHFIAQPDKPDWSKDVVVVTGGATGIGQSVVELLSHKHKAQIAVLDIAKPEGTTAPGAPEIFYVRTDVTKADDIAKAHEAVRERFGKSPSYVIACAGIAVGGGVLDIDPNMVRKTFEVNTLANVILAREFVPSMVKRNHGHFVTLASGAAYLTIPMLGSYSISKAGALAFHEELAVELRALYKCPNVRTTLVTPLKVNTLLGHALSSSKQQFLTPDLEPIDVAVEIVDALDSGESQNIAMPAICNLLPLARALPDYVRVFLYKRANADSSVTAESIAKGLKAGYGKNWDKADFDAQLGHMKAMVRPFPAPR